MICVTLYDHCFHHLDGTPCFPESSIARTKQYFPLTTLRSYCFASFKPHLISWCSGYEYGHAGQSRQWRGDVLDIIFHHKSSMDAWTLGCIVASVGVTVAGIVNCLPCKLSIKMGRN